MVETWNYWFHALVCHVVAYCQLTDQIVFLKEATFVLMILVYLRIAGDLTICILLVLKTLRPKILSE